MTPKLVAFCVVALMPGAWAGVRGTVVDATSRKPIAGASVHLALVSRPTVWIESVTGPDGVFRLAPAFEGECAITASKHGYLDVLAAHGSRRVSVTGQGGKAVDISLFPTAAITGTVVESGGQPLQGARVGTIVQDPFSGLMTLGEYYAAVDDRGVFRLEGLAPGRYRIALFPSGSVSGASRGRVFPPLYFPASVDLEHASPIRLGAGEERTSVSFVLPATGRHSISVKLFPEPVSSEAVVTLFSAGEYGGALASTYGRGDSEFRFDGLPPGRYRILAGSPPPGGQPGRPSRGASVVDLDGTDSAEIQVEMRALADPIEGRFDLPGVEGAGAACWRDAVVSLRPVEPVAWERPVQAQAGSDGTFRFVAPEPARHRVLIRGLNGCFVAEVRVGGAVTPGGIVAPGDGPILVVLTREPGELAGTVRSGPDAVPGVAVGLAPVTPAGFVDVSELRFVQADPDGGYLFTEIAPGSYRLAAVDPSAANAWRDPAFWEDHKDQTALVSVTAGRPVRADITVLRIREGWR